MGYPIITLTTDFGWRDSYVAEMKAVILGISPNVAIVDVSHEIGKFNVRMGAYVLASAAPYFPRGTIHVGVVDPGVGTKRKPVILQTDRAYFVGPDNGLFALAVRDAVKRLEARRITNPKFVSPKVSSTFHGRDIFAPAAAHLARGVSIVEFGPKTSQLVTPAFACVVRRRDAFVGEIIHVDDFGNVITNFGTSELKSVKAKGSVRVQVGGVELTLKRCNAYGDVKEREPLAVVGSHGFLEISVNQGSAADVFSVEAGDRIVLYRS